MRTSSCDGRAIRGMVLAVVVSSPIWAACTTTGSVELRFDVPADDALAPAAAATVTLVTEVPGEARRSETHAITDGFLALGELPVSDGVRLAVALRSPSQRLLGYGRSATAVDVTADADLEIPILLRRPFAYVSGAPNALATFDSTVDADVAEFKGAIPVARTPLLAVPTPDGAAIVVVAAAGAGGELSLVSTSVHEAIDVAPVPLAAPPTDAAVSADGAWAVVGHGGADGGISVIDLAAARRGDAMVEMVPLGNVGAVATALTEDGGTTVFALIDRAEDCAAAPSTIRVFSLGGSAEDVRSIAYGGPLMDVAAVGADDAATDNSVALFVADGCASAIVRLDPDDRAEPATLTAVPALTVIAALGGRVWGLGSEPPQPGQNLGARLVLASVSIDGDGATEVELPEAEERAVSTSFNELGQVALQQLDADLIRGRDLAIVPGSEQVAVIQGAYFAGAQSGELLGQVVIPDMVMNTDEYLLVDTATGTISQRVRTRCDLSWDSSDFPLLDAWTCTQAPGQAVTTTSFVPAGVAVLYGAR